MKTIWFTGIPGSGKSTLANKLHLYLEHHGKATIYLDDEAIKRATQDRIMEAASVLANGRYDVPYTVIIASTNVPGSNFGGVSVYCDCTVERAAKRDYERYPDKDSFETRLQAFKTSWITHSRLYGDMCDLKVETGKESIEDSFKKVKEVL